MMAGWVDIIVGNVNNTSNQLILGNGGFGSSMTASTLLGGTSYNRSVAVAGMNNDDGSLLDILVGNTRGQNNQVILNAGGA